jgi:alkanesulfonate monooxygenase SsuD/methylene tetrahydromethanopterin reductase-like flavin-dependent oxidoreductase (luciferase family)
LRTAVKIGIGIPNVVLGTPGPVMPEWAQRAEAAGFSSLATIDRIVYPSYDSLIALAACASVTDHIGLMTNILIGPIRSPVLLAKDSASVDRLSSGRLTLGLAVGGRPDDYEAVGADFSRRGERFDRDLELMHEVWKGKELSDLRRASVPLPGDPVKIVFGGTSEQTLERIKRWGGGWTAGGGGPDMAAGFIDKVRDAWKESGQPGEPRIIALHYFALGPRAEEEARAYLRNYYEFLGQWVDQIIAGAAKSPGDVKNIARRFEDIGVGELIFDPTIGDVEQVDRLADAVL